MSLGNSFSGVPSKDYGLRKFIHSMSLEHNSAPEAKYSMTARQIWKPWNWKVTQKNKLSNANVIQSCSTLIENESGFNLRCFYGRLFIF